MTQMQATEPRSWRRLDGVDCLRALAIFYVLMNHVNMQLLSVPAYRKLVGEPWMHALVWQGQNGVQIFFAVSGFLITSTTMRRWGSLRAVSVREFYLLRFARIAPLFLTLLALLSVLHLLGARHFVVSKEDGGLANALFAALTFHTGLLEATRGYLPGSWDILWSLSVEELFYVFFPLACFYLKRGKGLVILLGVFVVLGPFARTVFTQHNPVWREYSYLGGMDAIALGCLTAMLLTGQKLRRATVRILTCCGVAILVFCLGFEAQVEAVGLEKTGLAMTVLAIGACMLIAAAAESRWQAPLVLHAVFGYGRRSYEVYLTHMFIVLVCCDFFKAHGPALRFVPLLFVAAIAFAGLLGEVVGRFFSEPANRWLRRRSGDGADRLGSVVQGA